MSDNSAEPVEDCVRCGKPTALCVCSGIVPMDHRIAVLILQHPQEQDVALGTARLTALYRLLAASPSLARMAAVDPEGGGGLNEDALLAFARLDVQVRRTETGVVAEFNARDVRDALTSD